LCNFCYNVIEIIVDRSGQILIAAGSVARAYRDASFEIINCSVVDAAIGGYLVHNDPTVQQLVVYSA